MRTIVALDAIVVNVSPKTNWTFVAVTLDDGAVGWGECSLNGWEPLLVAQANELARAGCGRTVADVGRLACYVPHSPGGLVAHAVRSAVEQALADLAAREASLPIARWLCAAPRATVPGYANINRGVRERSPAGFADAARRAVAAGYRAVKIAPFDGVIAADAAHTPIDALTRAGLDRVYAVRDAVGVDVAVMVDCHWRFDPDRARALLADIAGARPYWLECMTSEHPSGHAAIAQLTALAHEHGIRTAGGETIAGTDAALAMCIGRLYDVLMPDIKYAGGYAGMLAIADVCDRHGVDFAPHNPTGPVAHVASLHACAAASTLLWLEHQWNETPRFAELVGAAVPPLVDGAFVVPTVPGIGVTPDRAFAQAHPYVPLGADANLDPRLG